MMGWLLTFVVHSTLWCTIAWLFLRLIPHSPPRLRESVWHLVIAASLITPTVQTLTSAEAAVWRLSVPLGILGGEHYLALESRDEGSNAYVSVTSLEGALYEEQAAASPVWTGFAGILWLASALGLLTLYLLRLSALRRRLRRRELVVNPCAVSAMAALSRKAALDPPPRLTVSHNLGSPIVLGIGANREICVPVRALRELDEAELRALLGHEVAHHLRRDTLRLAVWNVLQAVFFFQPLLWLAVREVRLAAEELCDDWAANQTEDRLAMASCLAEVARWVVHSDRATPVPGIGRRRSRIERRVRRLMDQRRYALAPSRSWRRVGAAGLLVLALWFAPVVEPAGDGPHEEERTVFEHGRAEDMTAINAGEQSANKENTTPNLEGM